MATWTKIDDEDRTEDPPLPELWAFDNDNGVIPRALELFVERAVTQGGAERQAALEVWTGYVVLGGQAAAGSCEASPHDRDSTTTPFPTREEAQGACLLIAAELLEDLASVLRGAYAVGPMFPSVTS